MILYFIYLVSSNFQILDYIFFHYTPLRGGRTIWRYTGYAQNMGRDGGEKGKKTTGFGILVSKNNWRDRYFGKCMGGMVVIFEKMGGMAGIPKPRTPPTS